MKAHDIADDAKPGTFNAETPSPNKRKNRRLSGTPWRRGERRRSTDRNVSPSRAKPALSGTPVCATESGLDFNPVGEKQGH